MFVGEIFDSRIFLVCQIFGPQIGDFCFWCDKVGGKLMVPNFNIRSPKGLFKSDKALKLPVYVLGGHIYNKVFPRVFPLSLLIG